MLNKKEYQTELARHMEILKGRKNHTKEELDSMGRDMPVRIMQSPHALLGYCIDKKLGVSDSLIILTWVASQFPFLNDIKVSTDVSYDIAVRYYRQAQTNTIILHRVNYILHEAMVVLYNTLEKDGRLRYGTKKAVSETEKIWDEYLSRRRESVDGVAFGTMLDHLRLANDAVRPFLERVYQSIRDNMISLGWRDVETKAWCEVVFLMAKVSGHSYRQFFDDFRKESGVDYSGCFGGIKMDAMVSRFDNVCSLTGVRTEKDSFGYYTLAGYNPENCQRFRQAWKCFINALRNDDLMDETAQHAISLNPEVQREYQQALEEENSRQVSESIGKLSEKFNVIKGKV